MRGNLVATVDAALGAAGVNGKSVLVAGVSGGVDSVVLAHLLCALSRAHGFTLHMAHFDHALRPTSAADARFVAELAAAWGLPLHTARWAHGGNFPGGVEAAARAARYAFLADVAHSAAPDAETPLIALAHHADDQAETLLLNLLRGSGLHGLAGMRALSTWRAGAPVAIVRPLLHTPRRAILAYAAAHGLVWREDASNADTARTRNFVRHAVIPLLAQSNPAIADTLARTATLLAQEADRLDALDAQLLAQALVDESPQARLLLRYDALHGFGWADRCALLRLGLQRTFAGCVVGHAHIEALAAAVDGPARTSGPHPLVGAIAWSVLHDDVGGLLSVHRTNALPIAPASPWLDAAWRAHVATQAVAIPGNTAIAGGWLLAAEHALRSTAAGAWELWLDPALTQLRLGTPRPGLRMAPLGMGGHTRSLGNLFTDHKIAPALRTGWPLLMDGAGRVLWLCGLVVADGVLAPPGAPALHVRWVRTQAEAAP